jgi:hypothetical protein
MPGQIRTNKKATEIAYKILKTPKDLQQKNEKQPSDRLKQQWFKDSSLSQ